MTRHYEHNGKKIPVRNLEWYQMHLGLNDAMALEKIAEKCQTDDPIEYMWRYLTHLISEASSYEDFWGKEVRACYDTKNFGEQYLAARSVKDDWTTRLNALINARKFITEVVGFNPQTYVFDNINKSSGEIKEDIKE
jgi:hypothetical protein